MAFIWHAWCVGEFCMELLVRFMEKQGLLLPRPFVLSYLVVILIGVYMIPLSGMTFFMLPHALLMAWQLRERQLKPVKELG